MLATVLVAVTLLGASLLILRLVERNLVAAAEGALAAALEEQAEILGIDRGVAEGFMVDVEGRLIELGVFVEEDQMASGLVLENGEPVAELIIDLESGEVVGAFDPFTGVDLGEGSALDELSELVFDTLDIDGEGGTELLVGGANFDEVGESVDAVRGALLVIVPILVVAFAAMTWALVGRSLRPVHAITAEAREITSSNLDHRVPQPSSGDEIAELAAVMNEMLDRLERGSERQRRFTSDASHEMRTPLATIRAAAELIELDPERTARLAREMQTEIDRIDALVGDLLVLSRLGEPGMSVEIAPVDLAELVHDLAGDRDRVEVDAAMPVIRDANAGLVRQAVTNLLDNAERHAQAQVNVRVAADATSGAATITVADDGHGVAPERRGEIFERFSRLDEARARDAGGFGLGLAIVRSVAEVHGGTVEVDEAPDLHGARFTVRLP